MDFWDKESVFPLSLEEQESRMEAREIYKKWVPLEETSWKQKSREIWFKERDRNMRFFHRMANAHRRRDQMARVKIDGVWVTQDKDLRVAMGRAFQLLLFTNDDWRPNLSELSFERLEDSKITGLEKPFIEEEVFKVLSGFCRDKAPVLDGFSMAFW